MISTRSHLDPNPPTIVDDPEKILWKTSETGNLATDRSIHKARSVPEHLTSLQDSPFDLKSAKTLFRSKSQSKVNFDDLEPLDLPQSPSREASPTTPPNFLASPSLWLLPPQIYSKSDH